MSHILKTWENTTLYKSILSLLYLIFAVAPFAQNVGIGITIPDPSAKLDISSTNSGLLIPRITTVQRTEIVTPATGLLVFDKTTTSFWFYNGTIWTEIKNGDGNPFVDADNDTKVDVEKKPDNIAIKIV